MIDLNKVRNIFLYTNKIDMRMGIIKMESILSLSFSPLEIHRSVFIFVSKSRKMVKIYYEDEYGKWLFINKLSYARFNVPALEESFTITKDDLAYLLKGVALISERRKQVSL
ncbi:MAG TPA: IS66 family insertion sequence element accessory protein TnpB [Bacilli bacterium]|nr:IS66 family insertion sequence element accessory protein TnpB [Bacilli bacterium]HPK28906.1 IS66 family insertion sequence element accessory protein TnpB [Bacilli bacterium]